MKNKKHSAPIEQRQKKQNFNENKRNLLKSDNNERKTQIIKINISIIVYHGDQK